MAFSKQINRIIRDALKEDAVSRDITTRLLIPKNKIAEGYIIVKENAVVCGLDVVQAAFRKVSSQIVFRSLYSDGRRVKKGIRVAYLKGPAAAILSGERVALNFLGRLSGIATLTNAYCQKAGPKIKIMDTRKTTPALRELERRAVTAGGGSNHRFDLEGAVLIKDNHKALLVNSNLTPLLKRLKKLTKKTIEIEVENLLEFRQALEGGADIILLDNMKVSAIRQAVALKKAYKSRAKLEASGGINLNNVGAFARTGVDRISIGSLTHSPKSIDVSLELVQ